MQHDRRDELLREIAATPAGQRAIRRALWRARVEVVRSHLRYFALRLFYLPGEILSLPEGDPRRWVAASVVLYVGLGIVALAWVLQ